MDGEVCGNFFTVQRETSKSRSQTLVWIDLKGLCVSPKITLEAGIDIKKKEDTRKTRYNKMSNSQIFTLILGLLNFN